MARFSPKSRKYSKLFDSHRSRLRIRESSTPYLKFPSHYRAIDVSFPVRELMALAKIESYNKNLYRPTTYLHKWWARRLGSVFRTIFIAAFSKPHDNVWTRYYQGFDLSDKIVLDPFMGGGTTVIEALRLGCKVIGIDCNPVAWWTVRQSIAIPPIRRLDVAFRLLEARAKPRINALYKTACPGCHSPSDILFVLWVKSITCRSCYQPIRLHTSRIIRAEKNRIFAVCPSCQDVFSAPDGKKVTCPGCRVQFDPSVAAVHDSKARCSHCQDEFPILDVLRNSSGPLPHEMYAIRYLCPSHGESFKAPNRDDLIFFEKIVAEYSALGSEILAPSEPILDGWKTHDLLTRGYTAWRDLFNQRQLLALDSLLRAILEIEDRAARECFLTLFSACLEFNNMFCSYKGGDLRRPGAVRHIFSHHAFVYPYEVLENNLWGARPLSGTFSHLYHSRLLRAKSFSLNPLERRLADGKVTETISLPHERIEGHLARSFSELLSPRKNALVLCQNSEDLPIPSNSVDAVITDPPYFDNVQYGELSDFFYVWLRLALKGQYQEFSPPCVDRKCEIVRNPKQGKTGTFYRDGLAKVFRECNRVLKKDGLLIFTFHHKSTRAWATVLSAVLEGGFYISATYPIHSEMLLSVHIHNQKSPSYDAILVCRKRLSSLPIRWSKLKKQIVRRAFRTVAALRKSDGHLSAVDTFVVVLGKCLEAYSRHYPNIQGINGPITIDDALFEMEAVVQSLMREH